MITLMLRWFGATLVDDGSVLSLPWDANNMI